MSSIALFGAGSWGTALSVHLASVGREVTLWVRRPDIAADIRQTSRNPRYLPDLIVPSSVTVTADLASAAEASDLWGMALPSQRMREWAEQLRPHAHDGVRVVSLAKGIENDSLLTMTQVLTDVLDPIPSGQIGVLSGPSHAEEVADGRPTSLVAAASREDEAQHIQKRFMTERMRIYVNTDVQGVEIGGAAKNVLAIAAGIGDGVGYGDNAKAALVTRGIAEIRRLGRALGATPKTFSGLSGIGDLVVTCMSEHSRNRRVGERIGQGETLEAVLNEMEMVAEGVRTTRSIYDLAKREDVEMPITEAVHAVLFGDRQPKKVVKQLMTRSAKREHWLPDAEGSSPTLPDVSSKS